MVLGLLKTRSLTVSEVLARVDMDKIWESEKVRAVCETFVEEV